MKIVAVFVSSLALASAFAPQSSSRSSTQRNALFDDIFGMDLFTPVKEQNDYGARDTMKKVKQGAITSNSYVPAGLTADEYRKVRAADAKKASDKYAYNVKKAGKFLGFDDFYLKRGTKENGAWLKSAGRGHTFAKTKYDYSGEKDDTKGWGDAIGSFFQK